MIAPAGTLRAARADNVAQLFENMDTRITCSWTRDGGRKLIAENICAERCGRNTGSSRVTLWNNRLTAGQDGGRKGLGLRFSHRGGSGGAVSRWRLRPLYYPSDSPLDLLQYGFYPMTSQNLKYA